jgi:hypothetical protein
LQQLEEALAKREWVGLTWMKDFEPLCNEWRNRIWQLDVQEFAKAIEAELKEKNT